MALACLVSTPILLTGQQSQSNVHNHDHDHDHEGHSHRHGPPGSEGDNPKFIDVIPETPEFQQATDQFRKLLRDMVEYEIRFHNSNNPAEEKQYRQQWYDVRELAFEHHRQMLQAGLAEYLQAPQQKPKLAEFLFASLKRNVENDVYEGMLPIAQALFDTEYQTDHTLVLFALCCLAENEYELARKPLSRLVQSEHVPSELLAIYNDLDTLSAAWQEELERRQADAQGEPLPQAKIVTTKGFVVMELLENDAPEAVANFIWLAEQGFYNHKSFFVVLTNLLAQTGCPKDDGTGGPGYFIPAESSDKSKRRLFRGSVGLKLLPNLPDSGGSQYFFSYLPLSGLEEDCTVFGRVIAGMPNLARLNRIDPNEKKKEDEPPVEPDEVVSIEILQKRNHPYEPTRLTQPFRGDSPPSMPNSPTDSTSRLE